ncbi:MAG: hypothetical protein JOZ64_11930 [Solirubrobacterales bacterium]|nr:hypothetical protein [Solirubrobacterales bacterium]
METRDIRTETPITACDVCGRTLLTGEVEQVYLDGGARRSVCELCIARASGAGWIREGTVAPDEGRNGVADHHGSLFGRLRGWWEAQPRPPVGSPPDAPGDSAAETTGRAPSERRTRPRRRSRPEPPRRGDRGAAREPRHVRAVPTSAGHKIAVAIEIFNRSEHQRAAAGVARSLGPPAVSVRPAAVRPSLVNVVLAWELCWYRYAIDLADAAPSVRLDAQGYELSELAAEERQANALYDERGVLSVPA